MKTIYAVLAIVLLIGISIAAEPKTNPNQINWAKNINSQIHGITNGTAAQDAATKSQLPVTMAIVNVQNSAQTNITGSDTTRIPFATELSDADNRWNGTCFSAPATGNYMVTGAILTTGYAQASGKYHLNLYKNNAFLRCIGTAFEAPSGVTNVWGMNFGGVVTLSAGDVIDLRLLRGDAGNVSLFFMGAYNHMQIHKV